MHDPLHIKYQKTADFSHNPDGNHAKTEKMKKLPPK
jgi:hypothetical protein